MSDGKIEFEQVAQLLKKKDVGHVLEFLASHFRNSKRYAELFEVLKATIRHELDLPILYRDELDELNEEKQRQLEDRLLEACRDVGMLLLTDGKLAQAWVYLQPLPDRRFVEKAIKAITVDEKNVSDVIDIALYQWAAPEFGFDLLLQRQGTCNAITFFDTQVAYQTQPVRSRLANRLVRHIHDELCNHVAQCIADKEGVAVNTDRTSATSAGLRGLIENREWLFEGCGHHLDVTHLASAVRIAKFCEGKSEHTLALDLCRYGRCLDQQLQYPSDAPFENTYLDHQHFFHALLDIDFEHSINHFRNKLNGDVRREENQNELATRAVLIEILARTGHFSRAINESIAIRNPPNQLADFASLVALAKSPDDFDTLMNFYESRDDLLGYTLSGVLRLTD